MIFRKPSRSTLERLKHFALALMLVFAACVYLHDDGHPESISESEKAYVLTTLSQLDQQVVLTIERTEQFISDPENTIERADALTEAYADWAKTLHKVLRDPVFYYSIDPEDESQFATEYNAINAKMVDHADEIKDCLLYTSPSPRDATLSRMPSSA